MKAQFSFSTVLFCLVLAWISTAPVAAQIAFGPQQVLSQTKVKNINGLKAIDLDGDGLLDPVINEGRLKWVKNSGAAGFTEFITIATPTAGYVRDFAPFDMDGDGDSDMIVSYGNKLVWYQNDGSGNFGTEQMLNPTANAESFLLADLDEDGLTDIIAYYISSGGSRIEWYKSAGNGIFESPEILTAVEMFYSASFAVVDINGDAILDLVFAGGASNIVWFANDGNNNFGAAQTITNAAPYSLKFFIAADLNNDGWVDLAWIYRDIVGDRLVWQINDGFGNFTQPQELYSNLDFSEISQITATDFDFDGDIDLLISEYVEGSLPVFDEGDLNTITLLTNDGMGNFSNVVLSQENIWGACIFDVADLNNDGNNDILLAFKGSDLLYWLQVESNNTTMLHLIASNEVNDVSYIETIDINGNGNLDIIGLANDESELVAYSNLGNSTVSLPYTYFTPPFVWDVGFFIRNFIKADVYGDGFNDLIYGLYTYSTWDWDESNASIYAIYYWGLYGIEELYIPTTILYDMLDMYAADLDGDGDIDMIFRTNSGNTYWLENEGTLNFTTVHNILFGGNTVGNLLFVDVDGDNDMDIVTKLSTGDAVWLVNDGSGNFSFPQIIGGSSISGSITDFADFNGDGFADMLIHGSPNNLYWLAGDGAGNFSNPQMVIAGVIQYKLNIADIDNDGDADIVVYANGNIYWYENDGNGNFGSGLAISNAGDKPFTFCLADFDGDGDLDIIAVSYENSNIFWYENQTLSETDPLAPLAAFTTLPAPNATQPDTLYICQGQTVQFFNQSENANAFLWNFGNGATATAANPAYTYPQPGTYEVTLTAYSNFPQPNECEANAGEWEAYGLVSGYDMLNFWPINTVNYTTNPNYTNYVLITNTNTNEIIQIFTAPLTALQQQTVGEYFTYNYMLPTPVNIYAVSIQNGQDCNPYDILFSEGLDDCCVAVNQLTDCSLLRVTTETIYNETTEEYVIDVVICTTHPYFLNYPVTLSIQDSDDTWSYQIWDLNENNCTSGQINTNGISGIYNLYFGLSDSLIEYLNPCNYMVEIPATAPRLMQMPAPNTLTDTAYLVVVVEPGFSPDISCAATVCQGATANYSTNADCETYLWEVTGGQILSGQGTPVISVEWTTPPLGSISLSAGCGTETCNQPTVAAVPIISDSATITGQTVFCLNETLQYSAPYFGGTQYYWSIVPSGAGSIVSGQGSNLITVQWGAAAATLQLTYQNALLDCGGTASLAAQPKGAFALNPTPPVCQGNTVTITANTTANLVWAVSGGEIVSGQNSPAVTLLCTTSGNITVSATPVNPTAFCNATAQTTVTVVAYPQMPETITGSAIICPLQTYTYTAAPPQPNTQFVWTITGGSITAGQNSPTVQVQWNSLGAPYSLSVVRQTLTSPVCTSLPATLSVSALADSPFTINGATTVCPNTQKVYQISPVLPNAAYTWSVNPPDAALLVQGQNSGSAVFLFSGNTSGGAATITASYCNLTAELPVNIGALPMPAIVQSDTLCTGSTAQLSVADLAGAAPYTGYLWKNSAGAVVGTGASLAITNEGVYTVQVTNASGCVGIASHRAYQYTSPVAQAFANANTICIQNPNDANLLAIAGTNYAFQWLLNGSVIPDATTPFYTHLGNDVEGAFSYQILVTDTQNTCSKLSLPRNITHILCNTGGGGPGDTIISPPLQCPPVAGYLLNFTLSANSGNCNTVTLNAVTSGSFSSFTVNWGDGVTEPFNGVSATHTYPVGAIMGYSVMVTANYTHPVTGNSCVLGGSKNHILPLVSRFDAEPACVGNDWVFQCRSYYLPTTAITQRTWDFGDGTPPVVGTTAQAHAYTAPGTYTVTLTITNGDCVITGAKTITVSPLPDAGFTISGGECAGSSWAFSPNQTNLATYTWQLGNGITTAQPSPNFAYAQAGVYEVSLQVQDNNGCASGIQTQTLTVLQSPEPQPISAADTVFCAGNFATLTAPAGGASYLWTNGQTTPQITVGTSGNYAVQVTLPDGCLYTSPPVPVQAVPVPSAAISPASPVHFCPGESVTLQAPQNANYTYTWSENDNGLAQNTFANEGAIGITVTDTQTGCTATGSAQLVAAGAPAVPLIFTSLSQICEGQTASINIVSATNAQHTYQWTNGATGTGIVVGTSGNHGVWATNPFGCSSDTSVLANIVVNPLPDAGIFPAGCYAICPGSAISVPPNTAQNYQWYYNGNPIPNLSGSSLVPQNEGAYWVVMSSGNCTITTNVLQLEFSANCPGPLPVTLLSFTGSIQPNGNLLHWTTATEVNNAYFTLQASPDGRQFTPLAQLPGAGNSANARNYQFLDTQPYPLTYYRLLQTDFDGSQRQIGEVITLQRTQPNGSFALTHITPNPTQNTATLTYTTPQPTQPTTLHLYDLTGRLLFNATLQPSAGINSYVLDMTRYPQGVYVVTLNNGAEVVTGKVVRE